jgi:hypothetical protein
MQLSWRPRHSLLLIDNSTVARVDLTGRRHFKAGVPVFEPRRAGSTLQDAVIQASRLGSKRLGPVSVISPAFWTDILLLPDDVVRVAMPDEIRQALALDSEAETGLSSFDSQLAFQQLESDNRGGTKFLATQVSDSQLSTLAQVIRACGSRLHSVSHPVAIDLASQQLNVETNLAVGFNWNSESYEQSVTSLTHEESQLQHLADCWFEVVNSATGSALLIRANQPNSQLGSTVTSSALAVVAALGCYGWNLHCRGELSQKATELAHCETQQTEHTEIQAAIKQHQTRLVQLRKEVDEATAIQSARELSIKRANALESSRNSSWEKLIDALADHAGKSWIQSIQSRDGQTIVQGVAETSAQPHEFASRLEEALSDSGWIVSPAITSLIADDLYSFIISCTAIDELKPKTASTDGVVDNASPSADNTDLTIAMENSR